MCAPARPNIRAMEPAVTDPSPGPRRFRLTLTHQILLGLVLGCLIGWLWPMFAVKLQPISKIFLNLIKMIVAPLLITTLVVGIAGTGAKMVGWLGLKAIIWFELATTVALGIGLATANLVQPGAGVPPRDAVLKDVPPPQSLTDFIINIFPTSIFDALAKNSVLQIVVFSVFLGLAVGAAGPRAQRIREVADAGAEAMFKLVGIVMYFAPFGVAAAIAVTVGDNGAGVLLQLLKVVAALYGALLVFFVLLFAAVKVLTRTHMPTFLRAIREPALIAFTTASSEAAMPRAMQVLEQLGIPRRIVGFVVPTGYAFNLDGSTLYLSLAVVFVAQVGGVNLTWPEQIGIMLYLMLATKGVAGVPRAAIVVLTGAVDARHWPGGGVSILLGIDAVLDMGRTCVNVVGNCVATVIVAAWEKAIPPDAPLLGPGARAAPALPSDDATG